MMKNLILLLTIMVVVCVACSPQPLSTDPGPSPVKPPEDGDQPVSTYEVVDSVIKQLAGNLGLDPTEIFVVQNEQREFNDACLGVDMPEVMCAQVITPGRMIVLESGGIQFEYHVSDDGVRVQPATLALEWSRDGGIAGFCDRLTVFLSGEVYGNQCKIQDGRMKAFSSLLSNVEQEQFFAWITDYETVNLDASDPKGVSDGMTLLVTFHGTGRGKPGKPIKDEIFNWAQAVYTRLFE